MKIFISRILIIGFVGTLTSSLQAGDTLTQTQAINLAEKFIADNGYTLLPANKSKLSYELLDQLGDKNVDTILKWRHNTLQEKAFCISEDKDRWDIGFLSTSVKFNKPDTSQLQTDLVGRAVIVMKNGKEIRIAHKDPLFTYFIILQFTAEDYFMQGYLKDSKFDNQGAMDDFTKAIKLNPQYSEAYKMRGNAKYHLEDYQGAIEDFTIAIELKPTFEIYRNRGRAKKELQDYQGAISDYTKAIELNPKYTVAYINRGNTRNDLKNYQEAIADFNKAIELDPKDMVPYYNRGLTKDDLHDYQGAIADFTKAIELSPKYAKSYYIRGLSEYSLNNKKAACLDWEKAKELGATIAIIEIQNKCK